MTSLLNSSDDDDAANEIIELVVRQHEELHRMLVKHGMHPEMDEVDEGMSPLGGKAK